MEDFLSKWGEEFEKTVVKLKESQESRKDLEQSYKRYKKEMLMIEVKFWFQAFLLYSSLILLALVLIRL